MSSRTLNAASARMNSGAYRDTQENVAHNLNNAEQDVEDYVSSDSPDPNLSSKCPVQKAIHKKARGVARRRQGADACKTLFKPLLDDPAD